MLNCLDDELVVVGQIEDAAGRPGVAQLAQRGAAHRHLGRMINIIWFLRVILFSGQALVLP